MYTYAHIPNYIITYFNYVSEDYALSDGSRSILVILGSHLFFQSLNERDWFLCPLPLEVPGTVPSLHSVQELYHTAPSCVVFPPS